ncbi:hypothetical protein PR048_005155 [Dryococelus australis]|uniref:Uncharacterized protein n=1 Tax=Dryococelus australis TaxID=614101 RepID=A0ABQ9I7E5_9NEOP|nr:hypothetical protein PR048_005155 [Dryococelus australis]
MFQVVSVGRIGYDIESADVDNKHALAKKSVKRASPVVVIGPCNGINTFAPVAELNNTTTQPRAKKQLKKKGPLLPLRRLTFGVVNVRHPGTTRLFNLPQLVRFRLQFPQGGLLEISLNQCCCGLTTRLPPGEVAHWFPRVGLVPDDDADRRVFRGSPVSPALANSTSVDLCFTAFGVETLVFVYGNMKAYCNILDNEILPTLRSFYGMDPCYFQDDNARCHVLRATMQWYADNNGANQQAVTSRNHGIILPAALGASLVAPGSMNFDVHEDARTSGRAGRQAVVTAGRQAHLARGRKFQLQVKAFKVPRFYAGKLRRGRLTDELITLLKIIPMPYPDSNPEPPAPQIGGTPNYCERGWDGSGMCSHPTQQAITRYEQRALVEFGNPAAVMTVKQEVCVVLLDGCPWRYVVLVGL